jgi:hypothetical protein
MKWIDGKTLYVEGRIDRTDLKKEWGSAEDHDGAAAAPAEPANAGWEDAVVQKATEADDGKSGGHGARKTESRRGWANVRPVCTPGHSDSEMPLTPMAPRPD